MKLTDTVDIMTSTGEHVVTLRAHVGYAQVLKRAATALLAQEELQVMLPPHPAAENTTNHIKWRGKTYRIQGEIKIYRRNGRDHHFTLTLGDLTG